MILTIRHYKSCLDGLIVSANNDTKMTIEDYFSHVHRHLFILKVNHYS